MQNKHRYYAFITYALIFFAIAVFVLIFGFVELKSSVHGSGSLIVIILSIYFQIISEIVGEIVGKAIFFFLTVAIGIVFIIKAKKYDAEGSKMVSSLWF